MSYQIQYYNKIEKVEAWLQHPQNIPPSSPKSYYTLTPCKLVGKDVMKYFNIFLYVNIIIFNNVTDNDEVNLLANISDQTSELTHMTLFFLKVKRHSFGSQKEASKRKRNLGQSQYNIEGRKSLADLYRDCSSCYGLRDIYEISRLSNVITHYQIRVRICNNNYKNTWFHPEDFDSTQTRDAPQYIRKPEDQQRQMYQSYQYLNTFTTLSHLFYLLHNDQCSHCESYKNADDVGKVFKDEEYCNVPRSSN
ncbi:hypothetical protein AGLY_018115 [Aphis glycines]|uniref:Uncharacterized protein n=1 Tax=Aphis glycines TaxID=307491 RepID=A0A6G0SUV1_APHGL|nr:hypothetical protein AGLY_018115 [Aphis glycines]